MIVTVTKAFLAIKRSNVLSSVFAIAFPKSLFMRTTPATLPTTKEQHGNDATSNLRAFEPHTHVKRRYRSVRDVSAQSARDNASMPTRNAVKKLEPKHRPRVCVFDEMGLMPCTCRQQRVDVTQAPRMEFQAHPCTHNHHAVSFLSSSSPFCESSNLAFCRLLLLALSCPVFFKLCLRSS